MTNQMVEVTLSDVRLGEVAVRQIQSAIQTIVDEVAMPRHGDGDLGDPDPLVATVSATLRVEWQWDPKTPTGSEQRTEEPDGGGPVESSESTPARPAAVL